MLKKYESLLNLEKTITKELFKNVEHPWEVLPKINEFILKSYFSQLFDKTSIEKSKKLPEIYKKVANKTNSLLINLNDFAETSNIDGLHYDIENHNKIARKIIEILE